MTTTSRRQWLLGSAAGAGAALLPAAAAASSARLPLTAATTEGPYYFDARQVRRDITEGHTGVPLQVRLTVLDTAGQPWRGARVDIWHCDAQGIYSGYAGQGDDRQTSAMNQTFLRGTQMADGAGLAVFDTIYPGWYPGRTTHIHVKVLNGSRAVLTTQFFLPDALSEYLYTQLPDYHRASLRDTLNSTDGIAIEAGETVVGTVREGEGRYVAALTLVADPAANPAADRPPVPGDGPPPGPPPGGRRGGGRRAQALQGPARADAMLPTARRQSRMPPRPPGA